MGVLRRHSRARQWPLKGDQGLAPAWAASTVINFNLNNIPKFTDGNKANYVPALALTSYGTYTTNAAGGRVSWEQLCQCLYGSFDLVGAWHGRPMASQHMRGVTAPIWELIGMGYQSGSRHFAPLRSSDAAHGFRHTLYLPLSLLLGDNPFYNAQLSVLFKDAQLQITTPANGITPAPNTAVVTIGTVNLRCSAVLVPQARIALAPGQEFLEFRQAASTGSDDVSLESLGNATALEGVEPGAGVDTMLALCSTGGLGGSFAANTLTQFAAPFIEQTQTQHLDPLMQMWEQASRTGAPPRDAAVIDVANTANAITGIAVDNSGFPYGDATEVPPDNENGAAGTTLPARTRFIPILVAGSDLQLTKIPIFEGTATYYRTATVSGTDRTLVHQFKSWSPSKIADFRQLVISEGYGKALFGSSDLVPVAALDNAAATLNMKNGRFLPIEFKPPTPQKGAA